jgi:hypothetical protein
MTLPSNVAVVIRGGAGRDPSRMLEGLRSLIERGEPPRVSVFAQSYDPAQPLSETVRSLCYAARAPWGQVQVSTLQRIRDAGFDLVDERTEIEAACHYHVYFSNTVTIRETRLFIDCFDDPVPNPIPREERKRR